MQVREFADFTDTFYDACKKKYEGRGQLYGAGKKSTKAQSNFMKQAN